VAQRETHTVSAGYYGPYAAKVIDGFQAGSLAPYSDSSSGFISAGETKNITYLYNLAQVSTGTLVVMHISNTGTLLKGDVYMLPTGVYGGPGLYGAETIPGYTFVSTDPGSAPLMGVIGADQVLFITHRYSRQS
jgi:hypothetical protein